MANDHGFSDETLVRHARGTLDAETSATLERAAAVDERLAAEMALARGLISVEASDPSHREFNDYGWARLSRALEPRAEESPVRPRFAVWQMAAAATLAVIVWQFGALPLLDRSVSQDATYELAGASDVAEFSAQVTFVPDVGEADLRVALLSADAQIASGPTALGVYGLRFRDETSRKAGVADLRVRTDVVESIEAD